MTKESKVTLPSKKIRVIISLISCFILSIWGVFTLFVGNLNSSFVPALLAVGGFIGLVGGALELKKMNAA
ncbi:hypothetical protein AB5I83_06550 [Mesobacillus sp. LC4]